MKATARRLPKFKDEAEERAFWARQDSVDYVDWSTARRIVLPRLRPSLRTISLRLPGGLLSELHLLPNQRDVPYQSLLKLFLAERVRQERRRQRSSAGSKRRRTTRTAAP